VTGTGPGRLIAAAVGAAGARVLWRRLTAAPPGGAERWVRTNHRGEPISLLEGPVATLAAAGAVALAPGLPGRVRAAGTVAVLGAGSFGVLDDLAERGTAKGFRGHLGALRRGEVTTGLVKIVGIGATGLIAGALAVPRTGDAERPAPVDLLSSGLLVAGAANLANLFDLRPGRALKVVLLHAPALASSGPGGVLVAAAVGPAAALLPQDLGERSMLGDCGANALGALLGTAIVAGCRRPARLGLLAAVTGLIVANEKVSFTTVIESTPVLRELDGLGRRPR
jgi:hypothetical protein